MVHNEPQKVSIHATAALPSDEWDSSMSESDSDEESEDTECESESETESDAAEKKGVAK